VKKIAYFCRQQLLTKNIKSWLIKLIPISVQAAVLVQANAPRKLFLKVLPIQSIPTCASIAVHAQTFAPVKQFTRNNRSKEKTKTALFSGAVFCFKMMCATYACGEVL
jgi:hypothetical protein